MGSHGADGLDFHPGLRVAYVEYCKIPVGQGRLTFDATAPKMSQTQFIKLMQDVGIAEPEGHLPVSSISIIFSSFKPLGSSRMLFPHFFRALGAVSAEAKADVHRAVAHLGSRSVDLQYLSSIKVFPDKAYPYILTRGTADIRGSGELNSRTHDDSLLTPNGTGNRSQILSTAGAGRTASAVTTPTGSTAALRATHIAKYAAQPFGGQAVVSKQSPSPAAVVPAPRESWRAEQFQVSQGGIPGPDSPNNIGVTVYHVGLNNGSGGLNSSGSQRMVDGNPDAPFPPNHHHMEQWGLWEPPKGPDGQVPGWVNYLLNRMDRLESELSEARRIASDASIAAAAAVTSAAHAPGGNVTVAVDGFVTHETLRLHIEKVQEQIEGVKTSNVSDASTSLSQEHIDTIVRPAIDKCNGLENTLSSLLARVDAEVASLGRQIEAGVMSATEKLEGDLERIVGLISGCGERVATVSEETVPALEGAMTELAAQVLELQTRAERSDNSDVLQSRITRIMDDAAVDRTQLLTTTSLMDSYTGKTEQLTEKISQLEALIKSGSAGGAQSTSSEVQAELDGLRTQVTTARQEVLDRLDHTSMQRVAELQELRDTVANLRDELRAKTVPADASVGAGTDAVLEMQRTLRAELSDRIQKIETRVGPNDEANSLQDTTSNHAASIKALQEQLERNLQRITEETAVDRSQQITTNTNMSLLHKAVDNLKPDVEKLLARLSTVEEKLNEVELSLSTANEPIISRASSMLQLRQSSKFKESHTGEALPPTAADIEAILDAAAALEDKYNALERMLRGTSSAVTALEQAQSANSGRIAQLEAGTTADGEGEAHGGATARIAGGAGGADVSPEVAKEAVSTALEALGLSPQAVGEMQQSAKDAQSEVVKIKVSFGELNELLTNLSDRTTHLETENDNIKTALDRLKSALDLNEKMKLLNGNSAANDDTVASQAELTALTEKVLNMENTLVQTLLRMDSNIAQTAIKAVQNTMTGEQALMAKSGVLDAKHSMSSSGSGRLGGLDESERGSKGPRGSIMAVDGHVAGGSTDPKAALKSLNPQRDKLAAALMETDAKVTSIDEVVTKLKTGQDTLKGRLKELAEALVALSNKAQNRLTKLESFNRSSDTGAAQEVEGDRRSSSLVGQNVSAAHRALDQSSSQLTGMNRLLAKRLEDLEDKLGKINSSGSGRLVPRTDGTASEPGAAGLSGAGGASLEDDVRGLGQDIVALHGMLQTSEAALRQAITEDCVHRDEIMAFQKSIESNLAAKEAAILKLAQQLDELKAKEESF